MNNNNTLMTKLMSNHKIKNLGLKKDTIIEILNLYNDIAFDSLLENGYIELDNGLNIEVVQLTERVHVLRGTQYRSSRKYKLKLTMRDDVYKKIESYYDKLQEDII